MNDKEFEYSVLKVRSSAENECECEGGSKERPLCGVMLLKHPNHDMLRLYFQQLDFNAFLNIFGLSVGVGKELILNLKHSLSIT